MSTFRKKKILTISKTDKVNVIIPSQVLRDIVGNRKVYNIPKHLPMIVPPKLYTKDQLGGYLLNNELTTNTLIKKKMI